MKLERIATFPGAFVLAKPSGLACHRSELVRDRVTVASLLREELGTPAYLVHRLDRGTSGCLLVATHAEAVPPWAERLAHGTKTYTALVRGFFPWDDPFTIETPLSDGKGGTVTARTTLRCLRRTREPRCSLLQAQPDTGRFHQIRRHLRDLGYPILGDSSHGDTRVNQVWRRDHGLTRLALHCAELDLGDGAVVRCPMPEELSEVLRRVGLG